MALPTRAPVVQEQLTSLINSMADGVLAVDHNGKIVVYNGAVLNLLDRNTSVEGLSLEAVLRPVDKNDQSIDILEFVRAVSVPTVDESLRLKYQDGSISNLYLSVSPVLRSGFGQNRQNGYVLVLRDITRQKSLEEERNEFISVVSHELRTPIAIAEGNISNAQFITERSAGAQQVKDALKAAHDQVLFLADMINDLATLSRAERGKLTIEAEAINIHDLVNGLATSYQDEAAKRGLTLQTQLDPQLELLNSSKLYVREVLQNFITNALKYTEQGSITIGARPRSGGIEFTVSDTGIGISKSDQEKVFDKFFRSEDFRTRQTSGTGLGLYVTTKLAHILHAEISLESRLNHGSTFTIFIPQLATPQPAAT